MKVLITGGSSEMAIAIAKLRVAKGDQVTVTASSEESVKECKEVYESAGIQADVVEFCLEEPSRHSDKIEMALSECDALILNAATRSVKLRVLTDWDESDGEKYLRTNVNGNIWLLRRALVGMKERKFGRVVFISSLSAATGTSRFPYYCAAKSALEGLMLNLAVDYGEFNVLCNILRPGIIATARTKRFWKRSHYLEKIQGIIPAMKLGQAEQIAEAVEPMLSENCYMNGSVVAVSGGLPMTRSAGMFDV
jgi:3-oxoacyl-[acyl-carrier protein] reductase